MNSQAQVVKQLVLKDWRQHFPLIAFSVLGGLGALGLIMFRREESVVAGTVFFFIALILASCMLPISNIVNERKKQNLPFLMSLPLTSLQYSIAKLIGSSGMFLAPWLTFIAGAFWLIEVRGVFPGGVLPMALILLTLPLLGFAIVTAAALVGETEGWAIAANVLCNSSYGLTWYFLSRIPALMRDVKSPVPVWNSTSITVLSLEFAAVLGILGLTFYVQSRKRDFV